jgi:VWFA-related protein
MKNIGWVLIGSLLLSTSVPGVAQDQKRQDQKKKADQDWVVELKSVLVELRAVVTDRQGHIVEGLKKEDFEIREKGRLQDLSFFAEQHIGPASISQRVVPANVTLPGEPPPPEFVPARSVLLFVDTLDLTGANLIRVKQSLKKFIAERLTDQDSVAIVTSGGIEGIPVLFTRDRHLLSYFINRIAVWDSTDRSYFSPLLAAAVRRDVDEAVDVAIALIIRELGLSTDPSGLQLSRQVLKAMASAKSEEVLALASFKRTSLLKSISAASELMSRAPGQRVLFLFSEGFSMIDSRGNTESSDLQQAISKAVRAGVVIYSIDAKGLEAPADTDASRRGLTVNSMDGTLSPSLAGRAMSYISASEKEARDGITLIANDTGGAAFVRTNDINLALQKSFEANRIYYSLGYYPSSEGSGFREVTVVVKGHPEYSVRTQKGYLADDPGVKAKLTPKSPQQRLFQAMSQPIPETTLGVSARANYLEVENDKAQVSIQIEVDGKDLSYQEGSERAKIALELAGAIYDRRGRLVNSFIEKINGGVALEELEKVKRLGFTYNKRIELKPGFYQVRVGVLEPKTERRGTAASWVEVPDLSKGKLAMSSILLGAENDAEKAIADSSRWTAIKSYKTGTHLAYCVLIYNAPSSVGSDLTIQSEIAQNEKLVYESEPQPVSSRMISKDNKGIEVGGQLNLDLEPGFYELRVAIKDKSNHEFRRTVDFMVAR